MMGPTYLDEEAKKRVYLHNSNNPYSDVLPVELDIELPKTNYDGFFPQKGEAIIYAAPVQVFTDKEKLVGYTGNSAGASVRVTKGVTLHTGGRSGKAVRENVRDYVSGDYIITNKRLIFISNTSGFEYKLDKITAVKIMSKEELYIQAGKTIKNILVNEHLMNYVLGFTNFAIEQDATGNNLYEDLTKPYSEEDNKRIEEARSALNSEKQVYKKSTKDQKGKRGKTFLTIVIALIVLALIKTAMSGSSGTESTSPGTGVEQVLSMTDHPRITDNIEDVKAYYEKFKNEKIVVTDDHDYTNVYTGNRDIFDSDDSELYFIKDPSESKILGRISFILNEKQVPGLNLDKCMEMLNQYLPEDFYEVYKVDAAYITDGENYTVYTYAVRLKEGIQTNLHGEDEKHHPYYYAIYFKTKKNNPKNVWTIETDYSGFGGNDKGWIEKYATPWEVNLQDYKK